MFIRCQGLIAPILAIVLFAGCGGSKGPGRADRDAPQEFTETPTGLKYRVLRKSDGAVPGPSSKVRVHYRGWLDDGTEFENTYTADKGPSEVRLNQAMRGWTEGLQLVGVGGMIELEVPPQLGYGARGMHPKIPADATLHYIFELETIR